MTVQDAIISFRNKVQNSDKEVESLKQKVKSGYDKILEKH